MTIKQLKKLLKDIPDQFDIAMDGGDGQLMPICPTDSSVIQVQFNDTKEKVFVFVLTPCSLPPHTPESEAELVELN